MRRFFFVLLIISLCAAGGTWYWKTYFPEGGMGKSTVAESAEPSLRSDRTTRNFTPRIRPNSRDRFYSRDRTSSYTSRRSSGRQDMAMTISILSSVISALAAVAQAWFARRR